MPELPQVAIYVERLDALVNGHTLDRVRLTSPFVLRSTAPAIDEVAGKRVVCVRRLGKRIVLGVEDEFFLVIHLMIAGRLRWRKRGARPPGRAGLAAFDFAHGTLLFTEASARKRASLHLVRGETDVAAFDRGGLEVLEASAAEFDHALRQENHTLKRALTDPHILSGIGNAFSDEILHRARLSPFKQTHQLDAEESERLYHATTDVLIEWIDRLRGEVGDGFPEKVTAFHTAMAVHGKYRQPCPRCGAPIQHIVYGENEANYCATCQTGGRLLADRALSRLLKSNWPKTLQEHDEG